MFFSDTGLYVDKSMIYLRRQIKFRIFCASTARQIKEEDKKKEGKGLPADYGRGESNGKRELQIKTVRDNNKVIRRADPWQDLAFKESNEQMPSLKQRNRSFQRS